MNTLIEPGLFFLNGQSTTMKMFNFLL